MNGAEQPETMTSAEVEKTFNWRGWILWPGVMVLLYFLSFGPAVKASGKPENQRFQAPALCPADLFTVAIGLTMKLRIA